MKFIFNKEARWDQLSSIFTDENPGEERRS